jgi:hypothetical protein
MRTEEISWRLHKLLSLKIFFKFVSPGGPQDAVFTRLQFVKTIILTLEATSHTKSVPKLI